MVSVEEEVSEDLEFWKSLMNSSKFWLEEELSDVGEDSAAHLLLSSQQFSRRNNRMLKKNKKNLLKSFMTNSR